MDPDKHVEIKPQMAQHNSAENTGLACCWSTKTRYIHLSLIFLYFCLSYSRRSHNSRGNERRWNFVRTTEPFPIRIGQWELRPNNPKVTSPESYHSEPTRLPDWWTSLAQENFVSSSSIKNNNQTKTHWVFVIECQTQETIYTCDKGGKSFNALAINFRKKIQGKPYVTYGIIELTNWTSNFSIN